MGCGEWNPDSKELSEWGVRKCGTRNADSSSEELG